MAGSAAQCHSSQPDMNTEGSYWLTHFQKYVHNSLLILHSLLVILEVFKSLHVAKQGQPEKKALHCQAQKQKQTHAAAMGLNSIVNFVTSVLSPQQQVPRHDLL